jgi:hypothetical protein
LRSDSISCFTKKANFKARNWQYRYQQVVNAYCWLATKVMKVKNFVPPKMSLTRIIRSG